MPRTGQPAIRHVAAVQRAFAVLETLNRARTGTLAEISDATALPKSTTARLLETLIALGYVTRVSRKIGYCITNRVLALAAKVRYKIDPHNPYPTNYTGHIRTLLRDGTIAEERQPAARRDAA